MHAIVDLTPKIKLLVRILDEDYQEMRSNLRPTKDVKMQSLTVNALK